MTGIVIITYNSAAVIDACLSACLSLQNVAIVVVDNASQDNTVALVRCRPGVQLIPNLANRGFAGAANQGINAAAGETVLLLNPDAIPLAGVDALAQAALLPEVGAVGGKLVNQDGTAQTGFNVRRFPTGLTLGLEVLGINRLWPGNPVNRNYRMKLPDVPADVDQPAGAFLMIRRAAYQAIGGFDERFFPIWFEDVDFCLRLKSAGYRILYEPAAVAKHVGGHSANRISWESKQLFWYGSLLRYGWKHLSTASGCALSFAVILGCVPRMIWGLTVTRSIEPIAVYSRVVLLASRYLREGARGTSYSVAGTPPSPGSGAVRM